MNEARPTRLYRCFNGAGELLYVGASRSLYSRFAEHRRSAAWFELLANTTTELFSMRKEALAAERLAICNERPRFNVLGSQSKRAGHHTPRARGKVLLLQAGFRLPEDVFEWLKKRGEENARSMAAEVIMLVRAEMKREQKTAKRRKTP